MIWPWPLLNFVTSILAPGFPVPDIILSPSVTGFIVGFSDFACGFACPSSWGFCFPTSGCWLSCSFFKVAIVYLAVGFLLLSVWITLTLSPFLIESSLTSTSHVPSGFTVVSPAFSGLFNVFSISTSILAPFTPVPVIFVWPSTTGFILGTALSSFLTVIVAVIVEVDWSLYVIFTLTVTFFSFSPSFNTVESGV